MPARILTFALVLTLLVPLPGAAQQLRELFRTVSPSVVIVRTVETAIASSGPATPVNAPGLGSGVLISAEGRVLTASHVVQAADRVAVEFADGTLIPARVLSTEPRADLALLQLERVPAGAVAARLGDSDSLLVGDQVVVVGAPYGLSRSMTVGHVSGWLAPGGSVGGVPLELIQTDAAINSGNSGGPMFNLDGEVIGIVSHIFTRSGGFEGIGFAVSVKMAKALLLSGPTFWSGMAGMLLTDELAKIFNLPQPAGILVQQVANPSPAADLGLRPGKWRAEIEGEELLVGGDIILEVAGIQVTADGTFFDRVRSLIGNLPAGETVTVKVLREGRVISLSLRMRR